MTEKEIADKIYNKLTKFGQYFALCVYFEEKNVPVDDLIRIATCLGDNRNEQKK